MAYSNASTDKLYDLLPAYVREQDAGQGEALRSFLRIVESQADLIEDDIRQLYNDAFIETCEPWVIPYIGDLLATTPLFDESKVTDDATANALFGGSSALSDSAESLFVDGFLTGPSLKPAIGLGSRADVGKTIYYRRRKGTLPMLEELARNVTGWAAHAAEFFELLGWTQWLRNHVRPLALRTIDLRSLERAGRIAGPFDEASHTIDVRPPSQFEGWHNIHNVGFFLWRLRSYRMQRATARRLGGAGDFRYYFNQLGISAPLFTRQRREGDEAGLTGELHVPGPIRPARFFQDLSDALQMSPVPEFSEFYGLFELVAGLIFAPAPSMMVFVDGQPIPLDRVRCRNLEAWGQPSDDLIGIDVDRGRLALGPDLVPADEVEVWYHYGFSADLGGGPYTRRAWMVRPKLARLVLEVSTDAGAFPTIAAALAQWVSQGRPDCVIRISDNRTYAEPIAIEPENGNFIAIEAGDGRRPHLRLEGPLRITGNHPESTVVLSGLLIEGRVEIEGSIDTLRLLHTTLVPGETVAERDPSAAPVSPKPIEPSIHAVATDPAGDPVNTELRVELAFSICGPIRLPESAELLVALDSIIDGAGTAAIEGLGGDPGPPTRIERSTVRGETRVREIDLASGTIFDGLVTTERQQRGCVRFCFVPSGSVTPRRYRCQPDLAIRRAITEAEEAAGGPIPASQAGELREAAIRRVRPEYSSERFGQPDYLQLHLNGPREIATGSDDGSEQGAFCHLKQPQREANLRLRLEEYLPFGLEPGLIYVT